MKTIIMPFLLCLCLLSTSAQAVKGLAFVHGTGNQTNAYDDYWTGNFVNSVRRGLPDSSNYTVINCDFNQYMWNESATGCLAEQLTHFIQNNNITELILLTHSHGGNMVRWIESNPTYDHRYPLIINTISEVIALAPSSLGTPLADAVNQGNVFEQTLGWLLGYGTDAVTQQQVSWMATYNDQNLYGTEGRPSLPKPFRSVVGTDVESAVWDNDSYCAGYQNQVALETTQNWLDNCSDGFLNCSSQAGAGSVLFYDTDRTQRGEPLSHQQSRRDCFKLDKILRQEIQEF